MLRIRCPYCGERDEIEFRYRGDASATRPRDSELDSFNAYVYERGNPLGWHVEWWLHVASCRKLLKVARHTFTHEIAWIGAPEDTPELPPPQRSDRAQEQER